MHKFYFNDCLPPCNNQHEFITHLSKTLIEFNELIKKDLTIEKAIVTEKLPSSLFFGNAYSLADTISKIHDSSLRTLAFSYFQKYPIDAYFNLNEEIVEKLLTIDYGLSVNEHNHVALNLAMVRENEGFIFTVALHDDLKQHTLCLKPQIQTPDLEVDNLSGHANTQVIKAKIEAPDLEVDNLFGHADNTEVIKAKIARLNAVSSSNIEKLKLVLGKHEFSTHFEKDFLRLTENEQISIIEHFQRARDRKGMSPFFSDGRIIREVIVNKPKCSVYELRVFSPSDLRVFFNESGNRTFLSHIFFKNNTDQNAAIQKAHNILNKLILTT